MKVRHSVPWGIRDLTQVGLQPVIPTMTPVIMRAGVCVGFCLCCGFLTLSITHSLSSSQRQCLVVAEAGPRDELVSDLPWQGPPARAQLPDHQRGSEQEQKRTGGTSCWLRGFVFWVHKNRSPGVPANSPGKEVETLRGIKGVPGVSQLEK